MIPADIGRYVGLVPRASTQKIASNEVSLTQRVSRVYNGNRRSGVQHMPRKSSGLALTSLDVLGGCGLLRFPL
jgi:hypothetical protein